MSVTVRPYRRGGWEVDITLRLPDGSRHRERSRAPIASKSAAQRWGADREREWFTELTRPRPEPTPEKEVPTLEDVRAEIRRRSCAGEPSEAQRHRREGDDPQHPPGAVRSGRSVWTRSRRRKCSSSSTGLRDRAPKTVNNVLTVLNMLLKKAVEWDVIERMPCAVQAAPGSEAVDGVLRLRGVRTAGGRCRKRTRTRYLIVLLGGEAGLRAAK